ncbi:MAG: Asp-tRNA(Asn)/Glu-tRNA(Gln) amidotransferase subunit GatB [Methanospirillum sp.]|uniref:Asp-tRNA(Asn)/Glu-tRNA(Gln) amidotransferase subunit GatB n=1 Tax=Methanospirillum sp. TaxID=45200 RepID=UPI00236A8AD7|nr:Asp-tRNA(Asn)/Glu-tRNA(Gln) amidotransferase subunit GatB [Methanospirillum sp.]MDD1728673.1 Asp-tRNA(Asn)/Glu-tRNA(Gln) amidotransferase subunit GatB [Methanospirillum sp.]
MEHDDVIIGLEIHCQLNTRSKLFCGCSTDFRDDEPNTHTCPVCLGLPGSMPVLNKKVIEFAMRVAKALNCSVLKECDFSRKNYFYPDLNKAYQITQYDRPLAEWGKLMIEGEDGERDIRITRIHVEEDPGRSVHMGTTDRGKYTLIDYNRAGVPLIEIVTEPDLKSPKEARRFLNKLRATLEYLNVFDSEKEGSLRVDANISLKGSGRVEVKNISSYKGVEKALTFEITRQRNVIRRGQVVARETRHFVEARGITTSSRSKEEENDYRYFPEPDLMPMQVSDWVEGIVLPELPDARRERFMQQYGCSLEHARTLTGGLKLAEFYEQVAKADPDLAATWTADYLLGELNYRDFSIDAMPIVHFMELIGLLKADTITDKSGVEILRIILDQVKNGEKPEMPASIVNRLGLAKTGGDEITDMVRAVIAENPQPVADYHAGKGPALNFLVGQVMKKCRGRADPGHLNALLREELGKMQDGA